MHYQIKEEQLIHATKEEIWGFMISPLNLKKIAPDYIKVEITSGNTEQKAYEGMIITYIVHPVLGIPMKWITEITHVRDQEYFVDEQRSGPYKMWHHEHLFEETADGILMTDILTYIPPLGLIGRLANSLFIAKKLRSIFDYRRRVLNERFPG